MKKALNYTTQYLSNEMIENQAWQDLLKFQKVSKNSLTFPIYPEEVMSSVWSVEVEYVNDLKSDKGEKLLAHYVPEDKIVRINESIKGVEGRVSFSLAHEAGHISLHSFLLADHKGQPVCSSNTLTNKRSLNCYSIMLSRYQVKCTET